MASSSSAGAMQTRLAVLLFTDIVGSTAIKGAIGSGEYAQLLARHNELFQEGIAEVPGARVVKHTGDGYFAEFPTASAAVRFALTFQTRMRVEPWGKQRLTARVGIHVGEMVLMEMAGQADIVGLTADIAARIMGLAVGEQILLTAQAFNDARQFVNSSPKEMEGTPPLKWLAHGRYVFKGSDEPLDVYEVGIERFSPLSPPGDSEKAKRAVAHDVEPTLGWRPAVGLGVPGRPAWVLEKKIGEGGFGEVWLALHEKMKQERVFKFCFDADRLRSFKRELTLFRLLREALGDRKDVAQLFEVKLDEPPFYLESEYTPGGSLGDWVARNADKGGLKSLTLDQRIAFVANVAEAVAAAHSVGVLHKDIKPSNILIEEQPDGSLKPKLSDFGIGVLADKTVLQARQITETGMTLVEENDSSRTGTRMYSPPESLEGKAFTVQGDVYALGVLLYQMVIADIGRPLGVGWEREISDPLLREDIAACVDRELSRRLGGARELVERLKGLAGRRERAAAARKRQTWQRLRKIGVNAVLVCWFGWSIVSWQFRDSIKELEQRNEKLAKQIESLESFNRQTEVKDKTESSRMQALDAAVRFETNLLARSVPFRSSRESITVLAAMLQALGELDGGSLKDQPLVEAAVRNNIGRKLHSLGVDDIAESVLRQALASERDALPRGDPNIVYYLNDLAGLLKDRNKLSEAEPLYREALEVCRKILRVRNPDIAQSLENLANVLRDLNKLEEAEELFREALVIRDAISRPTNEQTCRTAFYLADTLEKLKRADEAEVIRKKYRLGDPATRPTTTPSTRP